MLRRLSLILLNGVGLLAASPVPAATTISNFTTQVSATDCAPDLGCGRDYKESSTATSVNVGGGFAYASGYRGGYAFASAIFQPAAWQLLDGKYSVYVSAVAAYNFMVEGAPDVLVPIHAIGYVSTSRILATDESGRALTQDPDTGELSGSSAFKVSSAAAISIGGGANTAEASALLDPSRINRPDVLKAQNDSFDAIYWVKSNTYIPVSISAGASIDWSGGAVAPQYATVSGETDPVFTIDDPAFAAFRIVGVPTGDVPSFLSPSSAVPEPATWAMMMLGFGIIGGTLRRRRRDGTSPGIIVWHPIPRIKSL